MNQGASCRWLPHAGWYVSRCREAFTVTSQGEKVRMSWTGPELDAAGWDREFRLALDRRINQRGGVCQANWRKLEPSYWVDLQRDRHDLDKRIRRRVRIYQFRTKEMRQRFGHLLSKGDD